MNIRAIAFYLPQFHPIPENDDWWGRGFTEWTNVAKARPLFRRHQQPDIPGELGFYDLRLSETREAQAELARSHGIHGFCYWHYWFGGKRLLERPFNEVLRSGKPDLPFCLAWANHSWTAIWEGNAKRILVEQTYPSDEDNKRHFKTLLEAFRDARYITVDGKPLFLIFDPKGLPQAKQMLDSWRRWAVEAGMSGVYLVAVLEDTLFVDTKIWDPVANGFDAVMVANQTAVAYANVNTASTLRTLFRRLPYLNRRPLHVYKYTDALPYFFASVPDGVESFPCVVPNWDNTPRRGSRGVVLTDTSPELFGLQVKEAIRRVRGKEDDRKLIFVKSWNEWAEGNYMEPSVRHGRGFLEAFRDELGTANMSLSYGTDVAQYPRPKEGILSAAKRGLGHYLASRVLWRFRRADVRGTRSFRG